MGPHSRAELGGLGGDLKAGRRDAGVLVDRLTQRWLRVTGRQVDLDVTLWLDGPVGRVDAIGSKWIADEAARLGGSLNDTDPAAGLVASISLLAGPGFDPDDLDPRVRDLYEHTSGWRMEVWSQWCPALWPIGWLLTSIFARRVQQLSLPLRPLETSRGMDSRVIQLVNTQCELLGSAWQRSLRSNGAAVYGGWYGVVDLAGRRLVRVIFPLPNGSLIVLLRPESDGAGALRLLSPLGQFGEEGAYLVVNKLGTRQASARRIPLAEQFDVYVDGDDVLRTDHLLSFYTLQVLRLHYRLDRRPQTVSHDDGLGLR